MKISLEEALQLVSFVQDPDGTWRVDTVRGPCRKVNGPISEVIGPISEVIGDVDEVIGYVRKIIGDVGEVIGDVGKVIGDVDEVDSRAYGFGRIVEWASPKPHDT